MTVKVTRRQAQCWLAPIRECFKTLLTVGESEERVDWCVAGFVGMASRLALGVDLSPLEHIGQQVECDRPLTHCELMEAMRTLKGIEDALVGMPRQRVKDAALTEQIAIELDRM